MTDEDRALVMGTVVAGLAVLQGCRDAALGDITAAGTKATSADALRQQVESLRTTVQGWTPTGNTANDLVAIRGVLVQVLTAQALIAAALADGYQHRAAVDLAAALGAEASGFLARWLFGVE